MLIYIYFSESERIGTKDEIKEDTINEKQYQSMGRRKYSFL